MEASSPKVSPLLAALCSLLLPGSGHIWLGQKKKGVVILIGALFTCSLLGLLNLLAALDAWGLARKVARGEKLGEWESTRLVDTLGNL